jgi:cyclophilin family peptidyl-prolyl cis-trans isomerase
MKHVIVTAMSVVALVTFGCSKGDADKAKEEAKVEVKRPRVVVETDMGRIVLELFPDVAPNHVKNFLDLANKGFYNGLTFHRVIKGFVIQGGDPKGDGSGDAGYSLPAEFSTLKHMPGTLAMARANDPNSASCQFYICLAQLPSLDNSYTIFGQTVEGMDVVNKIGDVQTSGAPFNRPVTPVKMIRVWEEGKEIPAAKSDSAK